MDVQVLEEYIVFARHLNYSKAAKHLFISQPTLHQHLARLEDEIGCRLIDIRNGRLTEAGEMFLVMIQPIVYDYRELERRYDEVKSLCAKSGNKASGAIRVWDAEHVVHDETALLDEAFRTASSQGTAANGPSRPAYTLVSENQSTAQEALDNGAVDISFFWGTTDDVPKWQSAGYLAFPLAPERCAALVKRDHPLASGRFLLKDLESFPAICSNQPKWENWCNALHEAVAEHGVHMRMSMVNMKSLSGDDLNSMFNYGDQAAFGPIGFFLANGKGEDPAVSIVFPQDCVVEVQPFVACREDASETVRCIVEEVSRISLEGRR